ncbi:MAG TPA: MlaD family protein [Gemmatimonadales bacterium]|nr:MlaD family protein [Gemmatimonadales bacterium]
MDLHYKQEVTVGTLVLIGFLLFFGGAMWLQGKTFSSAPKVSVEFENAGTLKRGSPVKVSGVTLGTVSDITYQGYGKVLVRLDLQSIVDPRKDAAASLATVGLVADAVVNFIPGTAAEPLPRDAVIVGTVERGLMDMGGEIGGSAKEVLAGLKSVEFKQLSENLNKTLTSFQRVAELYGDSKNGPMSELKGTMQRLQLVGARIDSVLASANVDRSLRTADSLMSSLNALSANAQSTAKQLDQILARINRGEGTLGKFASDTLFYDNAQRLVKSLQEFIDDLKKHPGKVGITVRVF